ncbi:16S rRNA (uracil(1498)-N(3))-methyltransferase [Caenimonas aquaedulcis]|uniref:Ribosomal RNA small subunit methyltransferase E n=1 Tax=Caenimonas aquaedulcis TaxID=2793270 RepID=A0A931H5R9_9BURK|nr:16S rRNA (uracil(1498)-N(3))-methyltransferase [Caenimonas aquaedulcis]MBG9388972.1 16S rRNA (uracil(1498)-N(3))-methyltransferase [Caenimonas aquaedulcis]
MPRFHCPLTLVAGSSVALPPGAARHVQVLRLQPGSPIVLFNGEGGEFDAVVERIGRSEVSAQLVSHRAVERETAREIHLAVGMPANERMDWLVEKATELGAASIQPLTTQRSVVRLDGERAQKKRGHWQAVAVAACEQCGRNRVPVVAPVAMLDAWLRERPAPQAGLLLSLDAHARHVRDAATGAGAVAFLSGPEGGLTTQEEDAARAAGFTPVSLGPRVLRAETAALAALAVLA